MNDRLNMVVVPTEVIWKWQQYGNNFIAVFLLSPFPSKIFFNLCANKCQQDSLYVRKVKPVNKIYAQSCKRNANKVKVQT